MSANLALPHQIVVHGFLFNRGEKMSKSVGNVIDPLALAKHYGTDQLRYFLLRDVPFGQDGSYSHEAIVTRINADLANDLGNLAQRCLAMVAKNCGGVLPAPGAFTETDRAIIGRAVAIPEKSRAAMADYSVHVILTEIWRVVADANRYFASEEPWAMRKSDPERMHTILYVTAEVLRIIAIMTQPFLPRSAGKLLDLLAVPENARNFANAETSAGLSPGAQLPSPGPVFPRYIHPEEDSSYEAGNANR
jgi:methionyl-tRNA synthetase